MPYVTPATSMSSPPSSFDDPTLALNNGLSVPQLAFGMYKVPANQQGETIVLNAIKAGYRHFDSASFYQNEHVLGRALRKSGLPREQFFITSKVWNDAVKQGKEAVQASVAKTRQDIGFGSGHGPDGYLDLCLIHWPVPGYFVQAYKALEEEYKKGRIRSLGLSNFDQHEYDELVRSGIAVAPVCNQMEASPVMYREALIASFVNERNMLVCAYKPLNRAGAVLDHPIIQQIASLYHKTPAQVMIRWCLQKGLIVACKSSSLSRMKENRNVWDFLLSESHMKMLDELTTQEALVKRREHEKMRKTSL